MTKYEQMQAIWQDVYSLEIDTETAVRKHFSKDYLQTINGVALNLDEYVEHVKAQKQTMKMEKITYQTHLEKNNELFAIYSPRVIDDEGKTITAEVIAQFIFTDNQIQRIHGQVRFIDGGDPGKLDM